jgi:6-carboxyhexanoate--CoA ligase
MFVPPADIIQAMWSVRMRASRRGVHVSGAEGLFEEGEVERAVREFLKRARRHPRGEADSVSLIVERLKSRPREIASLDVSTLGCSSPAQARRLASRLLAAAGVSEGAVSAAFGIVRAPRVMRGAALLEAQSGLRLEADASRGVRTSRLGVARRARPSLGRKLARHGINTATVREALTLATKAAFCDNVVAELCVSDDPDYTTGYVAARRHGYVRIPNMKKKGSRRGGRVYFVRSAAGLEGDIRYLEKTPALVAEVGGVRGEVSLDEIIRGHHS